MVPPTQIIEVEYCQTGPMRLEWRVNQQMPSPRRPPSMLRRWIDPTLDAPSLWVYEDLTTRKLYAWIPPRNRPTKERCNLCEYPASYPTDPAFCCVFHCHFALTGEIMDADEEKYIDDCLRENDGILTPPQVKVILTAFRQQTQRPKVQARRQTGSKNPLHATSVVTAPEAQPIEISPRTASLLPSADYPFIIVALQREDDSTHTEEVMASGGPHPGTSRSPESEPGGLSVIIARGSRIPARHTWKTGPVTHTTSQGSSRPRPPGEDIHNQHAAGSIRTPPGLQRKPAEPDISIPNASSQRSSPSTPGQQIDAPQAETQDEMGHGGAAPQQVGPQPVNTLYRLHRSPFWPEDKRLAMMALNRPEILLESPHLPKRPVKRGSWISNTDDQTYYGDDRLMQLGGMCQPAVNLPLPNPANPPENQLAVTGALLRGIGSPETQQAAPGERGRIPFDTMLEDAARQHTRITAQGCIEVARMAVAKARRLAAQDPDGGHNNFVQERKLHLDVDEVDTDKADISFVDFGGEHTGDAGTGKADLGEVDTDGWSDSELSCLLRSTVQRILA